MKIAIVNTWAISDKAIGGTERFVIDLAQAFANSGNEVDVYMLSGESNKQNGVNYININLFNINGEADEYIVQDYFGNFENNEAYINLAKKLEDKINVDKYDFIQLNSLLFLEAWKDKKRIFTIHTNPFEYKLAWGDKSYKKMLEIMSNYRDNNKTIFVAPSNYYANEYKELTNCKVQFIPHAIDKKRIETNKTRQEIIKEYKLNKNKLKIIVPSRLEPIQKQPKMLLDACCLLRPEEKAMGFSDSWEEGTVEVVIHPLGEDYGKVVDGFFDVVKIKKSDAVVRTYDDGLTFVCMHMDRESMALAQKYNPLRSIKPMRDD